MQSAKFFKPHTNRLMPVGAHRAVQLPVGALGLSIPAARTYIAVGAHSRSVKVRSSKLRKITLFGKTLDMPESRGLRIAIGVLLILGGIVGFLPILGFWMIPLGLLVLSYEIPMVRRWRRRLAVKYGRREKSRP